jgi:serine protease AprX
MVRLKRFAQLVSALLIFTASFVASAMAQSAPPHAGPAKPAKLEATLQRCVGTSQTGVIIRARSGSLPAVSSLVTGARGKVGRTLKIINAQAATLPCAALNGIANNPNVEHVSANREIQGALERTGATVGATAARSQYGYDGSGIGVAVIDSGVTSRHDDLADDPGAVQRVRHFVDFVGGQTAAYDDYGHGTHVAGIIAGNGFDSGGARSGIAPQAHLSVYKVLNGNGSGLISDVIAALDDVVARKAQLGTRVVNLSVAAGVYESYNTDPLTLAAREVVRSGIVVVAAAGNYGRSPVGLFQYGSVAAPGNAPWVMTVGASTHNGTIDRADDTMPAFSSRGPSSIDHSAKPDVVAPGVGIESLSDVTSAFYASKAKYLLGGTVPTSYLPYLSLSGTSMATPVVSGTVALMLQANPSLTPNAVKAILQYTAQTYAGFDPLTQGAGFLNAKGAVDLARHFAIPSKTYPSTTGWSAKVTWGNRRFQGGRLTRDANAWSTAVSWGAPLTSSGQKVEFGVLCSNSDCSSGNVSSSRWNTDAASSNLVWGTSCQGADCAGPWQIPVVGQSVVWGTNVVWGTDGGGDTVVWGTDGGDTVVWGTNVVWGTSCGDPSCEPVIWTRQ